MQTKLRRPLPGHRVHFVGIGGVGMAALAELLLAFGYEVSGSDLKTSKTVQRLLGLGVGVRVGAHVAESSRGADHVVVSAAVPPYNAEVLAAERAGAEVLSRAKLLGRLLDAGRGIAVTGTHGKTTTASMLASVLDAAGFEPSFVIGGDLNDVGTGARLGASDLVVAEADEAFGSFLELRPEIAVVTNVDLDHLEYYDGQAAIDNAFVQFLSQRRTDGTAVLCVHDEGVRRIAARVDRPVVTYGTQDADLVVDLGSGAVAWQGRSVGTIALSVPGRHNVLNAAGVLTAALVLGVEPSVVIDALRAFTGVERRFTKRGEVEDVIVIDDYAHNPQKVSATLDAAREAFPTRRIIALFQPHLYSRTLHLGRRFGDSFTGADIVVITDVYGAREQPVPGVSGRIVSDAVRKRHGSVYYVPRLEEAAGFVAGLAQPNDVVLTIGAGDVTTAAPRILQLLAEKDASV